MKRLSEEGIEVVGFSSDIDFHLLKPMSYRVITTPTSTFWKWFQANKMANHLYIQDHIHIGTKLKSRLLKSSIILPLEKEFAVFRSHLAKLIQRLSEDQHELCLSDISPKDNINYREVQKM